MPSRFVQRRSPRDTSKAVRTTATAIPRQLDFPRRLMNKRSKKTATAKHRAPHSNPEAADLPGLVISNYGAALEIEDAQGQVHRCTTRKKAGTPVCGDRVRWQATGHGDEGVVLALEPRASLLVRPDARGQLKPMAANVDQLIIVCAPRQRGMDEDSPAGENDQALDAQLLDRYLVAAALCRIDALILVNKADLFSGAGRAEAEKLADIYRGIGYPVLFTAAKKHTGLPALIEALKNKTSIIAGQSGVGKSSLAKALHPEQDIRIGAVSTGSGAGRHTTTTAALYHLPSGGALIDSPGVRDFKLWQVSAAELAAGFVEFKRYAHQCRFNNCIHRKEPGCAVEEAARRHEIQPQRLASYRQIAAAMEAGTKRG